MLCLYRFKGNLSELVDAMTAMESLASSRRLLKFVVEVENEKFIPLITPAWFVHSCVTAVTKTDGFEFICDSFLSAEETAAKEMEYRAAAKSAIDEHIQKIAERSGIKPETIKKPQDYDRLESTVPTWGRDVGMQLSIMKTLDGDNMQRVVEVRDYYSIQPKASRVISNRYLHENRENIQSGVPILVIDNYDELKRNGVNVPVPEEWAVVFSEDIDDPVTITTLINNRRCLGVIGTVGGLTRLASATNKPIIVEINTGGSPDYWLGSKFGKVVNLPTGGNTDPDKVIVNLYKANSYV